MNWMQIDRIIRQALMEDIGHRDITTDNLIPPDHQSQGVFMSNRRGSGPEYRWPSGFFGSLIPISISPY